MVNETIQHIMNRRSIRNFQPEPLTAEQLAVLESVALQSPTGMNRQPWQFHFITNQAVIGQISEAALETFRQEGDQATLDRMAARHPSIFYGAPLLVVISVPKGGYGQLDAGIAAGILSVAAQSLGLGSCIIALAAAAFRGAHTTDPAKLIQMPEGYAFALSVAIGHPATSKDAHDTRPEKITRIP